MTNAQMLETCPLTEDQQIRLMETLETCLQLLERGEQPDLAQLCEQHPDLAEALQQYVPEVAGDSSASIATAPPAETPAATTEEGTEAAVPRILGDYELGEEIGRGGMGIVFQARQLSLERVVAVKVLPHAAVWDAKQIARFQNEAQAAAQLNHPNIVSVYAIGKDRGTYYYSMPLIQGISLEQAIRNLRQDPNFSLRVVPPSKRSVSRDGGQSRIVSKGNAFEKKYEFPCVQPANPIVAKNSKEAEDAIATRAIQYEGHIRRVIELVAQAADALHYAHLHNIVHRDIKPSNLLIDEEGKLWITDFGLAQVSGCQGLTRSGDVLGTLKYMSPEQAAGKSHWVDHRSDIYSLGITLYELLTLYPVVDGEDRITMLKQIESQKPPNVRSRNPAVPAELENILLKAISKDREDRYASALLFAEDLRRYLTCGRALAHRPGMLDRITRCVRRHAQIAAIALAILTTIACSTGPLAYWALRQNGKMASEMKWSLGQLQTANHVLQHASLGTLQQLQMVPGTEVLQRDFAQQSLTYLSSFLERAKQSPNLDSQVEETLLAMAFLHEQLGDMEKASACYESVKSQCEQALKEHADSVDPTVFLRAHHGLASMQLRSGGQEATIKELSQLLEGDRRPEFLNAQDSSPQFPYLEAMLKLDLAYAFATKKGLQLADKQYKLAIALLQSHLKSKAAGSSDPVLDRTLVASLLLNAGMESTNTEVAHRLIEIATALTTLDRSPNQPKKKSLLDDHQLALCYTGFGVNACRIGEVKEALPWFRHAVQITQDLTNRSPDNFKLRLEHAAAIHRLGQAELSSGNVDAASGLFSDAVRMLEDMNRIHTNPMQCSSLAAVLHQLASVAVRNKAPQEARTHLERAIQLQSQALESSPDNPLFKSMLWQHQKTLEEVKKSAG